MKRTRRHKPMVVISGGGTGGHIFPAIAIARAIQSRFPDLGILFVGAKGKMEMQKVPEAGFPIEGLWISGLQRKHLYKNALFPVKLISSLWKSYRILRKNRPLLAIGVGGFASGPLLYMAARLKIPTVIQEQNNYPGITNKALAGRVDRICVAFEGMERYFPKSKIAITGNPVRTELLQTPLDKEQARLRSGLDPVRPVVFITGGSLGAGTINRAILSGLETYHEAGVQIIWQTGSFFKAPQINCGYASAFIQDMSLAYDCADLVIARAGALTLAELSVKGKPAILVPSPNVAEDHQTRNAEALVASGAALLIRDADAGAKLVEESIQLIFNPEALQKMEIGMRSMAIPDATDKILALITPYLKHGAE